MKLRGRTGFDLFRLGSVAKKVTPRAAQPVLIVPESVDAIKAESVLRFKNLVVAVDFSAGSNAAVDRALSTRTRPAASRSFMWFQGSFSHTFLATRIT